MNRLKSSQAAGQDILPISLIGFLARDPQRFEQFLALTGLGPGDFRGRLHDPVFQAMVLDQLLQDQSFILEFAAANGLRPEAVLEARRKLPGTLQE